MSTHQKSKGELNGGNFLQDAPRTKRRGSSDASIQLSGKKDVKRRAAKRSAVKTKSSSIFDDGTIIFCIGMSS